MAQKNMAYVLISQGIDAYGEVGGEYGSGILAITSKKKTAQLWQDAIDTIGESELSVEVIPLNCPEDLLEADQYLIADLTFDGNTFEPEPGDPEIPDNITLPQAIKWRKESAAQYK